MFASAHYRVIFQVRPANTDRDLTALFSPPLCRPEDIPRLLRDLELKAARHPPPQLGPQLLLEQAAAAAAATSPRKWFHVSDSSVSETSEEKVLKAQAYLLFYERIL